MREIACCATHVKILIVEMSFKKKFLFLRITTLPALVRSAVAVMKHHEQKLLGENIWLTFPSHSSLREAKRRAQIRWEPGGRSDTEAV